MSNNAARDMLRDLALDDAVSPADLAIVASTLDAIAELATDTPVPSAAVSALLASGDADQLSARRRRRIVVAAATSTLVLGGFSTAAATNKLPDLIQEVVADVADTVVPNAVPHPVKPVVSRKREVSPSVDAPGQIQKATKPEPTAPGPARPADPGAHGRAHHENVPSGDVPSPASTGKWGRDKFK